LKFAKYDFLVDTFDKQKEGELMGKQVFIEGEILLTDQIATVNFSGHSRIMKQTLILPTRIDVTGSTRLHFLPWVLLPEWIQGKWQPGEHWRFVGRSVRNTAMLPVSNVGTVLEESRAMREAIAELVITWVKQHQEKHLLKAIAPITASFVSGRTTAQTWYSKVAFETGLQAPLVTPGHELSDGLIQLNRIVAFRTLPTLTLCVVTQATKLAPGSLMAETFDHNVIPQLR
jgi:hypothetical protein